jgi:NAD(P)-dependent dehydrogenase (short-subunit alcohol dehydrogenase family)
MDAWSSQADVPPQHGKIVVVTGANSGLGLVSARVLAARGAHVIMAGRSLERVTEAAARVRAAHPEAAVEPALLDLASLDSIRAFAGGFAARHDRLDLLLNNAGLLGMPRGVKTAEGFDLQFGVNHLGHFALTGRLLSRLRATPGSRVVTVSSLLHRFGHIDLGDPMRETKPFSRRQPYDDSKLANLLFTFELGRRLERAGATAPIALAAHPGYCATAIQEKGARLEGSWLRIWRARLSCALFAGDVEQGALPQLRAATDPSARAGDYFGPGGPGELQGPAVRVKAAARAHDAALAAGLWDWSVTRTGEDFGGL